MYGAELYRRLAAETGVDPSWHEVGSLRLASTPRAVRGAPAPGRLGQDVRAAARADLRRGGAGAVPADVDRRRPRRGLPADRRLARSVRAGAGAWPPAPARAARRSARTRASSAIGVERGRVTGVDGRARRRARASIAADVVVNAGGMFAPEIGRMAGVTVPDHPDGPPVPVHRSDRRRPSRPAADARPGQPRLLPRGGRRAVHGRLRARSRRRGRSTASRPTSTASCCAPDWPRFEAIMDGAVRRVPAIADAGRHAGSSTARRRSRRTTSSSSASRRSAASSSPPASAPTASPAPGGIGRQIATWIVDGEPELDLWKMDIRRFGGAVPARRRYTLARTNEIYATYYDIHYPNEERLAGRPLRISPAYEELEALGAVFGEKSGWERPNWFEPNADDPRLAARERSSAAPARLGRPALVARRSRPRPSRRDEAARLFDESSFAKIEVVGPGAAGLPAAALRERRRRAGRRDRLHRRCSNTRGGIECDLTVTRPAETRS